jgi:2-isopropylmalate synthase
MNKVPKYKQPEPIPLENRKWPSRVLDKAPTWCSVDLRDGNQALPVPMSPEKKLQYFQMLVDIGFKEIEIGFPSASQDDYDFCRKLIDDNLIPDDVRISVLVQMREHLIEKTVEALKGVKQAMIHGYVAASDLHREIVFNMSRQEVKAMAIKGTQLIKDYVAKAGMTEIIAYEFSPEEFTDCDLDYVVDMCVAVKDTWGSSAKKDFVVNLPATVERRPPNHYADMIEYFCDKYPYMNETSVSLHAHNDQGCAIAATELALLAGADRVEGTIFGHGERTGNLDVSILALNLYSRGVVTGLDFSNMNEIVDIVVSSSGIPVHQRHPYAGSLVFTAFSGSHQDAIRKGIDKKSEAEKIFGVGWKVPYLHIDPADLGRKYEKLIRINSQSGKGGAVFVLEQDYGIFPPKKMHPSIGGAVQRLADTLGTELTAEQVYEAFETNFLEPELKLNLNSSKRFPEDDANAEKVGVLLKISYNGKDYELEGDGNGPISAAVHAIKKLDFMPDFTLVDFAEQTLGADADATALAFVGISRDCDKQLIYGAGKHENIDKAALKALFVAINQLL